MPRPRITTVKEDMMQEKMVVLVFGGLMSAGIGLEQFGGIASFIVVACIIFITFAVIIIWSKVTDLSKETSNLSVGINRLNTQVTDLKETMSPDELIRK